jgi:hypothetical protein
MGFTFQPRRARRRDDGVLFTRYLAASNNTCKEDAETYSNVAVSSPVTGNNGGIFSVV